LRESIDSRVAVTMATWWTRNRSTREEDMMGLGPIEYIVVGFPGNQFNGEILPELSALVDKGLVRILDMVFIGKGAGGEVLAFEVDEMDELAGLDELEGETGGLISQEDIEHAAAGLEPNSSAGLLIWEDLWAEPFARAIRDSGGILLEGARIPHDLIAPAIADLPSAK
jgi:hypothetical protein